MYTIYRLDKGEVIPLVYVLAPSKYKDVHVSVLNCLEERRPELNPRSIMIDFERSFANACTECFPGIDIRGCHFHFAQCIWRHIQSVGLQVKYGEDAEFAPHVKMLIVLAFVPVDDVVAAFETLMASDYFENNEDIMMPVTDYLEDT
nr:uncharacterized protein LOC124220003 [Neodiprion pinetum]